jgi:chemotaxis methyl-accepting protein methylase
MISDHLYFEGVATPPRVRSMGGRKVFPMDQPATEGFFQWLFERGGLPGKAYRETVLKRRIPACLRHLGVSDLVQARARIEKEPALVRSTINVVMLGVTGFYRDSSVFDDLSRLVRERVECGTELRVCEISLTKHDGKPICGA